jgi:hypothetical protein
LSAGKNASWIEGIIKRFIDESPENNMGDGLDEEAWSSPLVGFSSGDDPLYGFYKEDIGSFYVTPVEWFEKTFPGLDVEPEELTVISWILPQTEATKERHRYQVKWPNERWARARIFGEEVNNKLRRHVVETLKAEGYTAVSPMLSPYFKSETSEKYSYASSWSERHAAYAAGLGTFGLCDGLITPVGKAMRTGSVIAKIKISASRRPYKDHHAYCLYYMNGTCGDCIPRCPVEAISGAGHDKFTCSGHVSATRGYVESNYSFKGYGCGLCQTNVPCESRIPPELLLD